MVIRHEHHLQQAKKPQQSTVIEKAGRGVVYDRFGIPLAINKIQYNAALSYADIREIPLMRWEKNQDGKRVRIPARSEYINRLSQMLSEELDLDVIEIKDAIYGKAALLPHTPSIIKEDISEEQYYRLRMLEREWLGVRAERSSRRYYPLGKVGCDIIGYLGAINSSQYLDMGYQLRTLEDYRIAKERNENPFLPKGFDSPQEVYARLLELQEKSYTINDFVGKSGIEASYEEALRGCYGKHLYEIDIKGNRLKKLHSSRETFPGEKLTLTLSSELQDFAEKLLASSEGSRVENGEGSLNETWMRGGGIVAMIPQTGEIIALSSYPRFDPNDFISTRDPIAKIEKELAIQKWLESEGYIGAIWDGKRPIEREYYSFTQGKYIEEKIFLNLDCYLKAILPPKGSVTDAMKKMKNLELAFEVQKEGLNHPILELIKEEQDRFLIVDLAHLIAPKELFSKELMEKIRWVSLEEYHHDRQQAMIALALLKKTIQNLFHKTTFAEWRKIHFKPFFS